MNNPDTSNEQNLDNQLADFADKISDGLETQDAMTETELVELQDTIRQVQFAVKAARPDRATADRIHKQLLKEWKKDHPAWTLFGQQPRLILTTSLVIVITLFAASQWLDPGEGQIVGTATEIPGSALLFFGIVLALIFVIYWNIRNSKR
jgi:hypothetical protein